MPIYTVKDTKKRKTFDVNMSMSDFETFLSDNPHIKQQFVKLNIGDAVRLGIEKPDSYFQKNVIGRIQANVPGATKNTKFKVPREF